MTLPSPGPGRPEHPSYHEPGPLVDPIDFFIGLVIVLLIGGGWMLLEAVLA